MVKGCCLRQLAVMFGESGSGKSFALDLAVATWLGTPWRDRRVREGRWPTSQPKGQGAFACRLKALCAAARHRARAHCAHGAGRCPQLDGKQDALDVARAIVAAGGAQLVIVDTFAQVMPGANENAGEDVGRALKHCKGIHRATGAMVLLVHHSGKDASRGARGWSGLRAATDVELEVVRGARAKPDGHEDEGRRRRHGVCLSPGQPGGGAGRRWRGGVQLRGAARPTCKKRHAISGGEWVNLQFSACNTATRGNVLRNSCSATCTAGNTPL
jgi:hypothetical protein